MSSSSGSIGKPLTKLELAVPCSLPSPVSVASPPARVDDTVTDSRDPAAPEGAAPTTKPARKRKKHTKSRLGCTQCKTRKIKCSETRPFCTQCLERELSCTYPQPAENSRASVVRKLQDEGTASPQQAVTLNSTGKQFSMLDMQSFHAFLFAAYPNQPFANDMTWATHIPSVAYIDESLMHAVLAQGAFHLESHTGLSASSTALSHRVSAVAGVKDAIANFNLGSCTEADRDALIGSLFLLWYQSLYFEDGINDFTTLSRGASMIIIQLWNEKLTTAFEMKTAPELVSYFSEKFGPFPPLDPELFDWGLSSLRQVEPLCVANGQKAIYRTLEHTMGLIKDQSWSGMSLRTTFAQSSSLIVSIVAVGAMTNMLVNYAEMSGAGFLSFTDPTNIPSQILMAFKSAMWLIFLHTTNGEWLPDRPKLRALPALSHSIKRIKESLEPEMARYVAWPEELRQRTLTATEKWSYGTTDS